MEENEKASSAVAEINRYKNAGLKEIVKQLEFCNYESEGGILKNNVAFAALKLLSEEEAQGIDNFDIFEDRVKSLLKRRRKFHDDMLMIQRKGKLL